MHVVSELGFTECSLGLFIMYVSSLNLVFEF